MVQKYFERKVYRKVYSRSGECKKKELKYTDYLTRRKFKEGDAVLIKVETRTKDNDIFERPYTVVERIHERRYRLRNVHGKTVERNVEKMKRFLKEGGVRKINKLFSLLGFIYADHKFLQIYFMGNSDEQIDQRSKFNTDIKR